MASFPETILDEYEPQAARVVARSLLSDAAAQRERLGSGEDAEALHDFRVAVRRLRSWLRAEREVLGGSVPKRAHRWLGRLAGATNGSRDAEVFADWVKEIRKTLTARQRVGAAWLLERLEDERRRADATVAGEVDRDFERVREVLDERLPLYRLVHHVDDGVRAPSFAGGMAALLRAHAATLRRRLTGIRDVSDDEAAHRARIAGKRLRYLIEPIAPHVASGAGAVRGLKELQDTLGTLHDAHVWLRALRDAIEAAGTAIASRVADAAGGDIAATPAPASPVPRDPRPGLLSMAELVRQRARDTYETLRAEWLSGAPDTVFSDVDAAVRDLESRGRSGVEIERKYLLSRLPAELPATEVRRIEQGYLPGERLVERLRRVEQDDDVRFYRTVKLGVGVERTELEEQCSREVFETMWPLTHGRRVAKRRHVVPDGGLAWEIDEFSDRDLVLAEIELVSADVVPEVPGWLAPFVVRDVTGEDEYVNANLAR